MAAQSSDQRAAGWAKFIRLASQLGLDLATLKPDLRAAYDGLDDFVNANQGTINAAIPLPARSSLPAQAKALLFVAVVDDRFNLGIF